MSPRTYHVPIAEVRVVRAHLEGHPVLEAFHRRYGVEPERTLDVLTESVVRAMDMLGSSYINRMGALTERMTKLRTAIHLVYTSVLEGSGESIDTPALRAYFEDLHRTSRELADPQTYAERAAGGGEAWADPPPLPELTVPGGREGVPDAPTSAPREGQPIRGGSGATWREVRHPRSAIRLRMDVDGLYWAWPPLEPGVVQHFHEMGYRVWMDPSGAVMEEAVAGPSMNKVRRLTAGEEVMFTAGELGGVYGRHRMERAHGGGSPGAGGVDSPHGVAAAHPFINQTLENHGVEAWVRELRNNAAPGVDYRWRTETSSRRQMLTERVYTISVIVEGQAHDMVTLEVTVRDPDAGVAGIEADVVRVDEDMIRQYGFPEKRAVAKRTVARKTTATKKTAAKKTAATKTAAKRTAPAGPRTVGPSESLSRALGRTQESAPEPLHPAVAAVGTRVGDLSRAMETTLVEALAGPEDPRARRDTTSPAARAAVERWTALTELQKRLEQIQSELEQGAIVDEERLGRIEAALRTATEGGAPRWARRADAGAVRALIRALDDVLREP